MLGTEDFFEEDYLLPSFKAVAEYLKFSDYEAHYEVYDEENFEIVKV